MTVPRVTVLMPVYNGGRYLREAIESILRQRMSDFEFLIIDDGSEDESAAVVKSYADKRIRLIENGHNLGLIETLNKGLQMARGEYVARMDADDISLPRRLERQLAFMERRRDICAVSSYYRQVDDNGRALDTYRLEPRDFLISFRMCVEGYNPICHPAAMFRARPVRDQGGYSEDFPHAEDGALWFRLSSLGMKFATVPKVLLLYRCHGRQITQVRHDEGNLSHFRAYAQYLSRFLGEPIELEDAIRLSRYSFDENHIRNDVELEKLFSLKRRIALKFFSDTRLEGARVVLCVADMWSALLRIRKLDGVRAGYVRRLLRYSVGILHQGLKAERGTRGVLCKGLFMACLVRILLLKLVIRVRKMARQVQGV